MKNSAPSAAWSMLHAADYDHCQSSPEKGTESFRRNQIGLERE